MQKTRAQSLYQVIPWRRKWQPTPVLLPGKSHGQRSLEGYSPRDSKSLLQHHSSKASILRRSAFFTVQLSHPYVTTGKTIAMTRRTFVGQVMSLLLNRLSAAAAAKSLQSCPTLCDPIDGSPPGSPVPGILQAGTLEWVAISFSNA